MRALLQRVRWAAVSVEGAEIARIGPGLLVLLGVGKMDSEADSAWLARKTANLRIFADQEGKLNLSLKDIGGPALVVSQFTLYADCRRGNRPGFEPAAAPGLAEAYYEAYLAALRAEDVPVQTGHFQADMLVELANDGPVTILLERTEKED